MHAHMNAEKREKDIDGQTETEGCMERERE